MSIVRVVRWLREHRRHQVRLTLTYLAIIMTMSLGFSAFFYHAVSRQFDPSTRKGPRPARMLAERLPNVQRSEIDRFLQDRAQQAQADLLFRIAVLNVLTLYIGLGLSYWLAGKALAPIERSVEAQDQFISDASHELRTPITALQTTNEIASRKASLTKKETAELVSSNLHQARMLKRLSDDLLTLLRSGTIDRMQQDIEVQEIVTDAINGVLVLAKEKNIRIEDIVQPLEIKGDYRQLVQVMTILLENAIKYSNVADAITVRVKQRANSVILSVTDTGIGMSAEDTSRVFERFYRADKVRGSNERTGYGLGLAIARKIVEQHRGSISVESILGEGSTFTVTLPS